jgi:glutamyl-tRNA reductase
VSVVVIGLNHRTAPLDLLERMAVSEARLPKALHDLLSRTNVTEGLVLSTCNRTEVYAVAERFHGAYSDIRDFLAEVSYLPPEDFSDHLYVHYDTAAAAHLLSVTAGLDSAVVGESEIQGQVKVAWERARSEAAAGPVLNLLVRHALEAGKRARTETAIGRNIA